MVGFCCSLQNIYLKIVERTGCLDWIGLGFLVSHFTCVCKWWWLGQIKQIKQKYFFLQCLDSFLTENIFLVLSIFSHSCDQRISDVNQILDEWDLFCFLFTFETRGWKWNNPDKICRENKSKQTVKTWCRFACVIKAPFINELWAMDDLCNWKEAVKKKRRKLNRMFCVFTYWESETENCKVGKYQPLNPDVILQWLMFEH